MMKNTIKKVTIKSDVWDIPVLPPKPSMVATTKEAVHLLNDTNQNGAWRFLNEFDNHVPLPDDENQDIDFSQWENKEWHPVIVPGGLVMQGFDIENNVEYYYQREVNIPEDFKDKHILIRFHGVYTNARVWVNGNYIRTHVGGFSVWDCDVTDVVSPGERVTLTVGISDVNGKQVGIWNEEGSETNDPSYGSIYAHHNIGGINRDVELIALPKQHIQRLYIQTTFDKAFKHANLDITIQVKETTSQTSVSFELIDRTTDELFLQTGFFSLTTMDSVEDQALQIRIPVKQPKKWDAEHPNLYRLRTTLREDGIIQQVNEENLGFRDIHYGGRDGTDANKLYVNGNEIKLRSTCRHDVSYDLGRSSTKEQDYFEIQTYKEHNINSIRTSHYPGSQHLLDACDELGLYVEQETAVCFQGMWGHQIRASVSDFMGQFTEMVEFDRNRPSIIMWSIGNESSFPQTEAFALEYAYLKELEPTRPIALSWPFEVPEEVEPKPYDIYSAHYHEYDSELGKPDIPVYHDEYAHIACYNVDELQRDTNVRNFWGESIYKFWENIVNTDGALGGALWGGIDEVFYLPENTRERWLNHSAGRAAGYGEWGSVFDAYMRHKPEAYLTKKAYSPVRVAESDCVIEDDSLIIPVKNWFDHTSFNELTLTYQIDGEEEKHQAIVENIGPRSTGNLRIQDDFSQAEMVQLTFTTRDGIVVEENKLQLKEVSCPSERVENKSTVVIEETVETIDIVSENGLHVVFSKETGLLISAKMNGETRLKEGPSLHVTGAFLGDWQPGERPITTRLTETGAHVCIQGSYSQGVKIRFELMIESTGKLSVSYHVLSDTYLSDLSERGLKFKVPTEIEHVSWEKNGFHSHYPDDHIGRNTGTARLKRANGTDAYGVKPDWPWKDDMRNYFLYAEGDANDGLATNDFKAMRENILLYELKLETHGHVLVRDEAGESAARVSLFKRLSMIDDRESQIVYHSDGWRRRENPTNFNGTETYSLRAGAKCSLEFEGTGVRFIGARQADVGKVKINIDGEEHSIIDTFSDLGNDMKQQEIFRIENLMHGTHTIELETLESKHSSIVVDAFEVLGGNNTEESDVVAELIVNQEWAYPNLGWGNYGGETGVLEKGTQGRLELVLS